MGQIDSHLDSASNFDVVQGLRLKKEVKLANPFEGPFLPGWINDGLDCKNGNLTIPVEDTFVDNFPYPKGTTVSDHKQDHQSKSSDSSTSVNTLLPSNYLGPINRGFVRKLKRISRDGSILEESFKYITWKSEKEEIQCEMEPKIQDTLHILKSSNNSYSELRDRETHKEERKEHLKPRDRRHPKKMLLERAQIEFSVSIYHLRYIFYNFFEVIILKDNLECY